MVSKTKLLLVACSKGQTEVLARKMHRLLMDDYGLDGQVELLIGSEKGDIPRGTPKDHRHDLVCDFFQDKEVRVDIGANQLRGVFYGKHIAIVEHLLTPSEPTSVNDHKERVRGLLEVISNVETLQRTLVAPYTTYVRSHSIEKYRANGFYQFNSLLKMLQDFQKDGLNGLVTIDPHSDKLAQIAEDLGMFTHCANPFQSGRAINPYKLGLSGDKAGEVLKRLRPFQERIAKLRERGTNVYFISVDDGTERRAENVTERALQELAPEEAYKRMAYMIKDRPSMDTQTMGFKPFSRINEGNVPPGTYICIDDMINTGSTGEDAGNLIKRYQPDAQVELWVSHSVTMPADYAKVNRLSHLDRVVSLDTVPQPRGKDGLRVEVIPASAHLLASELYKSHAKLVASR